MNHWVARKQNRESFPLRINGLEALAKMDCKVRLGIRNDEDKVFRSSKSDHDLDLVDAAKLLKQIKIGGSRRTD